MLWRTWEKNFATEQASIDRVFAKQRGYFAGIDAKGYYYLFYRGKGGYF